MERDHPDRVRTDRARPHPGTSLVALGLALAMAACRSTEPVGPAGGPTAPRPAPAFADPAPSPMAADPDTPTGVPAGAALDLAASLAATLDRHPDLAAVEQRARAARAEERAADHRPGPTVGLDLEDLAGTGSAEGLGGAQTTLWVGLPIQRGGKRSSRVQAARAAFDLVSLERQLLAVELRAAVARAFGGALHAQLGLELAQTGEETAEQVLAAVTQRIEAGRGAPLERQRYAMARTEARLARQVAEADLAARRRELAALWGGPADFGPLEGDLETVDLPGTLALERTLVDGPRMALASARVLQAEADEDLVAAEAEADWTVTLGLRRYEETDDGGLVLGLEVPLPSRDRRADLLEAARARRDGQVHSREATARPASACARAAFTSPREE